MPSGIYDGIDRVLGSKKRMGWLCMIELLLKGLIGDEIRHNVSLKECSRVFRETS